MEDHNGPVVRNKDQRKMSIWWFGVGFLMVTFSFLLGSFVISRTEKHLPDELGRQWYIYLHDTDKDGFNTIINLSNVKYLVFWLIILTICIAGSCLLRRFHRSGRFSSYQEDDLIPACYVGIWKRFAANLLDGLIWCPVVLVLYQKVDVDQYMYLALALLAWLYSAIMESSARQGTIGKVALGIKIATADGKPISFSRASGRYLCKGVSNFLFCIGFLMIPFTTRKQGLHDLIAGTIVTDR